MKKFLPAVSIIVLATCVNQGKSVFTQVDSSCNDILWNYDEGIGKAAKEDSSTVNCDILPILTGHSGYSITPKAQRYLHANGGSGLQNLNKGGNMMLTFLSVPFLPVMFAVSKLSLSPFIVLLQKLQIRLCPPDNSIRTGFRMNIL
jgi:hypothetical protein